MPKTAKQFSERKRAMLLARNFRHGNAPRSGMSAEYKAWSQAIKRCEGANNPAWKNYGGRGIKFAEEWRHDFAEFLKHIGPRPSSEHQIDRINNDGNYEPGNVRWATRTENVRNRRNNVLITIDGVTKCASAWDESCAFNRDGKVVLHRYKRGWSGPKLLLPLGSAPRVGRPQSVAERKKRSRTMKRLRALGVYDNIGEKIAKTRRKQFANGTAYNKRDKRGCFV